MTISDYKLFLTIANHQSLSSAAEELHLTKSAVSTAIHKIEEELNITLFTRTNRGCSPTKEALRLIPYAESVIENHNIFFRQVQKYAEPDSSTLTVGTFISISMAWIPDLLRLFHRKYPKNGISISTCLSASIMKESLLNKSLDFAIGTGKDDKDIEYIDIYKDEMLFVCHPDYVLKGRSFVSNDDLTKSPLIVPHFTSEVETVLKKRGIELSSVSSPSSIIDSISIALMVEKGLGNTISSRMSLMTMNNRNITAYSFDPPIYRDIVLMYRKGSANTPFRQSFISFVKLFAQSRSQYDLSFYKELH